MGTDCSEDITGYWINFILQNFIDLQSINYVHPILAIWRVDGNINIGHISPNNSLQSNVPPFAPENISGVYFSEFETDVTTDDFTAWKIIYRRNDFDLNQNFRHSLKLYHQYWMFSTTDLSGLFTDSSYSNFLSNFFRIKNHNSFGLAKNNVLDTSINNILFLADNFDTYLTEVSGTTFNLRNIDDSINRQLLTTGKYIFQGGLDISNTITIHIPNGIQTIDLNPDNLKEVPIQIFPNLRNIYFDNSSNLTTIKAFSFRRIVELRELFFPSQLQTIQEKSFQYCFNLRSVYLDNINQIDNFAFYGCVKLVSAVIGIDAPLTLIPQYCFQDCISLRSFTVPRNIKIISEHAFQQCVSLVTFIFPRDASSIQYIGENAFALCSDLRFFKFPITNNINNVYSKDLFTGASLSSKETTANNLIKFFTGVTLNDNIHDEPDDFDIIEENQILNSYGIGRYAFMHCTSLESINLEDTNIRIINEGLFINCTSLTEITIPNTVTEIDRAAFLNCEKLRNVLFRGDSDQVFNAEITNRFLSQYGNALLVTNIGQSFKLNASQVAMVKEIQTLTTLYANNSLSIINDLAFANCTNLETIVIPPNVTHIGDLVFYGCKRLKYIYILGSLPAPFNSLLGYSDSSIFDRDTSDNLVTNQTIIDRINNLFNSKLIYSPLVLDDSGQEKYDFSNNTQENLGGVGMSNIETVRIIYVSDLAVGNNQEHQLRTRKLPRDIIKIPSNLQMGNPKNFISKSPQVIIYDIRSQFISSMNGFFTSTTINQIPNVYDLTLGLFQENTPIKLFSNTQILAPVDVSNGILNNPDFGFFGTFSTINALFEQYVNNSVQTKFSTDNTDTYQMIEHFINRFDNSKNYCIDVTDPDTGKKVIGDADFILFNENFLTNITSSSLEFVTDTVYMQPLLEGFKSFAYGIDIMRTIFIGGPESEPLILKFFGVWNNEPPNPANMTAPLESDLLEKYVHSFNGNLYKELLNFIAAPDSSNSLFYAVDNGTYYRTSDHYGYEISNNGVTHSIVPCTSYSPDELQLLHYLNSIRE